MLTTSKIRQYGFTLIELLVGVVVLGILASIAVPSFQTWIRNTEIRNAAESIANGLQRARAEAVYRNTNVAFTLGADTSWSVYVVTPASGIDSRSSSEGSKNVTRTIAPISAVTAANTATVTFNNLGSVQPSNADGTVPIATVGLSETGGTKNLRVMIQLGGTTKMCDPNAPTTSTTACN